MVVPSLLLSLPPLLLRRPRQGVQGMVCSSWGRRRGRDGGAARERREKLAEKLK